MEHLPNSIGDLKSLWSLSLQYNKFETLTSSISKIPTLDSIDLSYNFTLKTLPPSLKNMKDLYISCEQCYNLNSESGVEIGIADSKDFEIHDSGEITINLIVKDIGDAPAFGYIHYKDQLLNPHTLVIEDEVISVEFNYNYLERFELTLKNEGGFTRLKLYECISEAHIQLYENEMKSNKEKFSHFTFYEVSDYKISMVYFKPEEKIWEIIIHSTY